MSGISGSAGQAVAAGITGIAGMAGIDGIAGIAGISIVAADDCGRLGAAARINPHPAKTPVNPTNREKCIDRIGTPPFFAL